MKGVNEGEETPLLVATSSQTPKTPPILLRSRTSLGFGDAGLCGPRPVLRAIPKAFGRDSD